MSFLIDPPWLYATGRLYGRVLPEDSPVARVAHRATAAAFLATSISLYTDRAWTRPIWSFAAPKAAATGCSTPACSASTIAA